MVWKPGFLHNTLEFFCNKNLFKIRKQNKQKNNLKESPVPSAVPAATSCRWAAEPPPAPRGLPTRTAGPFLTAAWGERSGNKTRVLVSTREQTAPENMRQGAYNEMLFSFKISFPRLRFVNNHFWSSE